ncbi:MAG: prepilin-type N-terminal cleavage/methylation domain-containing protein [Planctomycetes bacterium]|nr:prepilin-type N-terminal cleavage/methylation domain-containing protein [Planctomycetota bacterium]
MNPIRVPSPLILKNRQGFTLVELMVALALIILMLSIMSQAFVIATGTMQGLKEVADMQEKIRSAVTLLQRDLGANHFEGSKKLSDPEFWDNGPPKEGYFMIWQDQPFEPVNGAEPSGNEGAYNGVSFRRSSSFANHMLACTVKLPAKSPSDFFESSLGSNFPDLFYNTVNTPLGMKDANIRRFESNANLIHSDWAEVAYFLGPHNAGVANPLPDGNTDGKTNPSTASLPYFNLYRQQRIVLPNFNIPITGVVLPAVNAAIKEEISCETSTGTFNKPSDLTVPWKRMGNRGFNQLGNRVGPLFSEFVNPSAKVNTDIIATNVISFDVKLLTDSRYDYEDLATILSQGSYSAYPPYTNYAIANGNAAIRVFDTWTTDQGSSTNPAVPKYDLGYWNNTNGKWQPSGNTAGNNSLIPVWNVTNNTGLNIKAIQISLRVWDQKSNTSKMFVIVQKL